MKKIGLIGGMSWESTQIYYQIMNEKVKSLLGGFHSCKLVLESVDFAEVERLQHQNDWEGLNKLMVQSATNLEKAGAELIVLCTNTMHLCADAIKANVAIPFIHIVEVTGRQIQNDGLKKVLLLGTKFTMERNLYSGILSNSFGVKVVVPNEKDRETIHSIIYQELVDGIFKEESRHKYLNIINKSFEDGVQGVILGCTEIPLLIREEDVNIKVYNTTKIHAESAINKAIEN